MSARVTAPVEGFAGVVAGAVFTDGVATTDDEWALAYFRRHGYGIDRDEADALPDGDPSDSWTKVQLLAWATANAVEVTATAKKAELLEAIIEHLKTPQQPDGQPPAE